MEIPDKLFVGESFWIEIPGVTLDDVPVTEVGDVDTFTYEVMDSAGEPIVGLTGSLAPHPTTAGLWRAKLSIPTPGRVIISAKATKGASSEGYWEEERWIHPRS